MSGPRGWAIPDSARIAHFFRGGESLCRQWKYGGQLDEHGLPSLNCRLCTTLMGEVGFSAGPTVPMVPA